MTGALRIQLWKELRALLPWWAALVPTVAILGAASQMQRIPRERGMGFLLFAGFVYVAGAAALGSLSFGHDYAHRTLGPLLALPVSRKRLLGLKAAVLLPLLGLLGFAAIAALDMKTRLFTHYGLFNEPAYQLMILGPMLAGGLLAPWLTMIARGPLAGAVFSVAIPVMIWMTCNSFRLGTDIVWRATLALAAIGGVMTVRTFIRQESIEGPHSDLALPKWLRRRDRVAVSRTGPLGWVGIALWKELRLQAMTFVVAGLFVTAWAATHFARWIDQDSYYFGSSLFVVTRLYGGIVAIMAGALPAAEERHFGTADWQVLMPVAAWKQWTLKCTVAIGLATILALGLPALLLRLTLPFSGSIAFDWEMVFAILYCSVTGLYLSSISPTGLRAILGTVPALAAITVGAAAFFQPLSIWIRDLMVVAARDWVEPGSITGWAARIVLQLVFVLLTTGLSFLVLTLAFRNHRSADRSRRRILRQVALILDTAVLAGLVFITVATFLGVGAGTIRLR